MVQPMNNKIRQAVERRFGPELPWWLDLNYDFADFAFSAIALAAVVVAIYAMWTLPS